MKKFKKLLILCMLVGSVMFSLSATSQNGNSSLTDPEIASIAVVANQNDIDFAEIAIERSDNQEVLGLARTMASDHQMVIDRAVELVTRLGVTPKDNALSKQLITSARETQERLKQVSDDEFDEAYVNNEVEYHQNVITAVEDLLIPHAKNEELKALLQEVLPILQGHLEHAQMIQKNL